MLQCSTATTRIGIIISQFIGVPVKLISALILVVSVSLFDPCEVSAQVPRRISFQAALTDNTGKVQPDGSYSLSFVLFDAESGGNAIWTSPTKTISVVGGLFSYILGSDPGVPTFSTVNLTRPTWLEVRLSGQALPNRFEITSTMYAMVADTVLRSPASDASPVGTVVAFAGTTAPKGWLFCNGQAVSRTVYYELFNVISTTYGLGDTTKTFNLPNLVGVFPRGAQMGGVVSQSISGETFAAQTIGTKQQDATAVNGLAGKYERAFRGGQADDTPDGNPYGGNTIANVTFTGDVETRPANLSLSYIIKY